MKQYIGIFVIAAMALTSIGCNASKTAKGAGIGAAAGAVIGGLIGNKTGDTTKGAAVGGAIGAAVGAIIGDQMDRQAAELKNELPDAQVVRDGDGIQVTFNAAILFAVDSDKVQEAAKGSLNDLAASMNKYNNTELLIVGHTDNTGSDTYNLNLSKRRATSVKNFIASQGIAGTRLQTDGKGEAEPVADNTTAAGRQANRRVEIKINVSEEYRQQLIQQQQQQQGNQNR